VAKESSNPRKNQSPSLDPVERSRKKESEADEKPKALMMRLN
jgi:hypothetical protein